MQPGDVPITYADISALERDYNYRPSTSLRTGLRNFAEWYKKFYINNKWVIKVDKNKWILQFFELIIIFYNEIREQIMIITQTPFRMSFFVVGTDL